jgi:hypothetical protein
MAFLLNLVELLLLGIVALDTLGFIAQNRKAPLNSNSKDFTRVCFTWVFFLTLRSLTCASCGGVLGSFYGMLLLLGKAYVSIPLFRGTEKLYNCLIEENAAGHYLRRIVSMIKDRTGYGEGEKSD